MPDSTPSRGLPRPGRPVRRARYCALPAGLGAAAPILRAGDIVDVVAPGFRCSDEHLERGVEFLRRLELVPRVPPDLFGADLLCANTDAQRFAQLRRALWARDSRAVWCVRGGYGALRLIPRLLRLAPPAHPKLFVGYSDATTLHYLLNLHWQWPSLHGPLLDRLGAAAIREEERAELHAVLFGAGPQLRYTGLAPLNAAARRGAPVTGRVFGGNLTVLQSLLGTPLQRRSAGILFLEDIGERGYRVDRMLEHFSQAGLLAGVGAVVFGTFLGGNEPDGRNLVRDVLERFAAAQRVPVFAGLDAGHGEYQRPVFLGSPARLLRGAQGELAVAVPRFDSGARRARARKR
ncbi:MAG TPA: LD-carboxypeptidase [Steroidobacteraceae bacterium]|nr:LD-carboxypeptidase [Steroidobacteraceae bacterium]